MHAETQSAPPQPQSPETSLPVKRERSPSPVLANTGPRLVTDGCVRFAPLPPECRAGRSGYKDARQNWVAREVKKLRAQGLQPTRTFVRDDGLVIDWKSKVPVMSDTLCPPAITSSSDQIPILIPDSAHPAKKSKTIHDTATGNSSTENDPLHHSQVVPMERRDDAPLPSIPVANASGSTSSRATNLPPNVDVIDLTKMEDDDPGLALDEALPTVTPPPLPSPTPPLPRRKKPSAPKDAPPPHISPDSSSDSTERPTEHSAAQAAYVAAISSTPAHSRPPLHVDVDAVQASALHFLHRFVLISILLAKQHAEGTAASFLTTFAEDRSALASAYSRAATFSFTSPTQSVEPDAVCSPTAYHRGRVNIVAALLDLPEDETADESAGEVEWDFLFAREAGDVLLICYPPARPQQRDKGKGKEKVQEKGKGKALAEARPGLLSCEQRFILRPRDWDEEDRDTPEMWPLVVVSHQMMFRRIQVLPG
ncbi:hypothetical protein C8Q78DRAFT_1103915 [Trametes maxima]|nr:hypothetical protein C8Q78DRAFT_1103915 [Trametes maxima]